MILVIGDLRVARPFIFPSVATLPKCSASIGHLPKDSQGRRHKLYGLNVNPYDGDIYLADAVDYSQAGVVYRYSREGQLVDHFRVGINPSCFAFK